MIRFLLPLHADTVNNLTVKANMEVAEEDKLPEDELIAQMT